MLSGHFWTQSSGVWRSAHASWDCCPGTPDSNARSSASSTRRKCRAVAWHILAHNLGRAAVAKNRLIMNDSQNDHDDLQQQAAEIVVTCCNNCRRKFRSQTSDNMDRWKAEQGRGREKRKIRRKKSRRERVRRKKMQMRKKVGKSRNTVFFQWFWAPEGRKVGSLKRRVRSQLARWEMKNCTPLWREAHLQVKMYKTPGSRTTFGSWDVEKVHAVVARTHFEVKMYKALQPRTTFGSCDVEKVHAVVARSTCRSQNVQSTPFSDHFWKFRCRKSARRCGAKHISKSKVQKTEGYGALLDV